MLYLFTNNGLYMSSLHASTKSLMQQAFSTATKSLKSIQFICQLLVKSPFYQSHNFTSQLMPIDGKIQESTQCRKRKNNRELISFYPGNKYLPVRKDLYNNFKNMSASLENFLDQKTI